MIAKTLAGSSIILLFSYCTTFSGDKNRPMLKDLETWPDSLVIETFDYGGMMPESDRLTVRKDSCILEMQRNQLKNRYAFVPKQNELNDLLTKLNDRSIDRLRVIETKGIMYDAPTVGLSIRLGTKFISISNGASEEISEKNPGDFRACYDLLNNWAMKAMSGQQENLCITIDSSVKNSKGKLSISPESGGGGYYDDITNLKEQVCFQFLQGKHSFQIHITEQDKDYRTKYLASIYPVIDLQADQNLKLILKNDSTLELK